MAKLFKGECTSVLIICGRFVCFPNVHILEKSELWFVWYTKTVQEWRNKV